MVKRTRGENEPARMIGIRIPRERADVLTRYERALKDSGMLAVSFLDALLTAYEAAGPAPLLTPTPTELNVLNERIAALNAEMESLRTRLGKVERNDERLTSVERRLNELADAPAPIEERREKPPLTARKVSREDESATHGAAKEEVMSLLMEYKAQGLSDRKIADRLNEAGVPTLSGRGQWQPGTISKLIKRAHETP